MAKYGIGNFEYEFTMEGGKAVHKFFDPKDPSNTAEASVSAKEMEDAGYTDADSREVSEMALAKVSKQMNEKRDKRIRDEHVKEFDDRQSSVRRDSDAREAHLQSSVQTNSEINSDSKNEEVPKEKAKK